MIKILSTHFRKITAVFLFTVLYSEHVMAAYIFIAKSSPVYTSAAGNSYDNLAVNNSGASFIRSSKGINNLYPGIDNRRKVQAQKDDITAENKITANKKADDIGGPDQPETQGFQSVNSNNMVDLFTGDFSYNIPLLDVGGYPVNIFYSSGISMDQEASWVGLGWNINPGTISRNMRGVPDDFNGEDKIIKDTYTKDNVTIGGSMTGDIEILGQPLPQPSGQSGSGSGDPEKKKIGTLTVGAFYNTYKGWGTEAGFATSILSGEKAAGPLGAGLSISDNSQNGITLNPSLGIKVAEFEKEDATTYKSTTFSAKAGLAYNSRSGLSSVQVSGGISYKSGLLLRGIAGLRSIYMFKEPIKIETKSTNQGFPLSASIDFASPTYSPSVSLPYRSIQVTFTLKPGGEGGGAHPDALLSGYVSTQSLAENERIIPAYGYLNSQNGAKDPNVLLDYNRDKEVIYRDKPAVNNIAIPSYTYDAFSISGEGTGGMFRAYRSDIGYVFDHRNDTKSESGSLALDLGVGAIVHGGTDINFTDAGSVTGPWTDNNPMGTTVAYKNYDANTPLFEPAYFRNPGEKSINDKDFYNRIGGDDVVTVGLAQNGIGPFISSTNRLDRYKDYKLIEGAQTMLSQANAFKQKRDKRTQVISYLTAEEAAAAGLNKTINSYSIDPATHKLKLLSAENRVDNNINTASYWRKKNHISEIDVLNSDGRRYVYGIPVYNKMQKEVTFAVAERHDDLGKGITAYTSNDNKMHNNNGQDEYYNTETTPSYAHSFLLTGILSSDYVDVTGDGVTPDDLGDGVKFNYTKTAGMSAPFKWRNPYCVKQSGITKGTYNEGLQTDNRDDKVSYIYGEKELWYLNSIESKTMIAVFTVENRDDLKSMQEDGTLENTSYAKRLKEINLYTRADFETLGDQAKPVKTVHFEYGYDLCKNVASDPAKGKLTLKKIWFTYNGLNKTAQHPYVFNYSNVNPSYNSLHSDKWGNYKNAETDNPNALTNAEYPYAIQDGTKAASNITAWTLTSIQLPSGGKMDITYESDDYAYIQNKRAMKMMNIAGFSNQKPTGTATSGSGADDIAGNRLYSKYGLISPLLQSNDKLYVTVKVPYNASDADEVYSKYFDGTDKMYFKLKVIMPSDSYGSGAEFIPCYAELDKGTSANPNYGTLGEGYIWFKIKGINLAGDGDGNYSPLAKAAIQFLRLNLPAKAYPGSETPDPMEPLDAVKVVSSMFTNMTQIFRPYDEIARQGDYASSVDLSRCFVRLTDPLYKKYGGGIRVKKITVTDNWLAMTNNNEPQSVYGQEYFYETTKTIDGAAKTISSGVATYEPMLGGEENPFRQPVEYTERISPLAPVTMGYAEEPYCETLFPAPMVGYSRVVVRSVNRGANIKSSNGSEETNFYTSYDFPVITDNSMLDVNTKKRYRTPLRSLIKIDAHHNLTMSQGFKIELNDMNGKIKSQASYSETDPDHPIAYSEYVYRTVDPNAEVKQLSNTVSTVNQNGDIDNASFIGEDIELMMDMREEHTFSFGVSFCPNLDLPAFWAFLSFVPMPQSEDNKFRSVATTKVIHRCGLLEKVIAIDKGSKVTTENLLYDSETGDVLLTKTANEFNDPIYNFTYPAHWAYSGMGPAYKNIGAKFGFNETTGYLNQAQAFDVTDGKAMAQSNGTLPSFIQYFESGDEILATGRIKNGETLDFPDCSGNQNCNGYNYSDNFTSQKVWAVDAGKIDPSANEGILFIDQYGNPYSAQDVTMKIIRSGRRNLLSASVGSVISMATPIRNNKIVFDDQTKVVTSGAGIFNDTWKVKDQVYLPPVLGRARGRRIGMLGEEGRGAALERDGDAEQVVGILRAVRHVGEQRRHLDAEGRRGVGHVEVVAPRQRLHVLAFHHGEAAEQLAQRGVAAVGRGALVEGAAAELDLEGHAHGVQRGAAGRGPLAFAQLQRAAALRAAAVGQREAFAQLAAALAAPLHGRAGAADVGAFAVVGQRALATGAQHGVRAPFSARRQRRPRRRYRRRRSWPAAPAPAATRRARPAASGGWPARRAGRRPWPGSRWRRR